MVRGVFTILTAVLTVSAGLVAHSEAKPPPACAGRFAIPGPLTFGGVTIDALTIGQDRKVSTGACGVAKRKVKGTKKGTKVSVLWPKCQNLKKVLLVGKLGTDCQSFTGSIKAKKTPKTSVSAQVSTGCGDGLVDPGLGEACEGSGCVAGEQCVTCHCEPIPTTSTTTSTTSSTSIAGTTSTTTTTTTTTSTTITFPPNCGNGTIDPGEECDDMNARDDDGCTRFCLLCGNGTVTAPEACDDGNLVGGDGCSASCTKEECGNRVVDVGETCDDGNLDNFDGCPNSCKEEACTPSAGSVRVATVNWASPVSVGSLTVLLDYPEGRVNLPGSGGGIPAGILFGFPSGTSPQANDIGNQGYALREVIVKATAITPRPGQLFKINFEDCSGRHAARRDRLRVHGRDGLRTGWDHAGGGRDLLGDGPLIFRWAASGPHARSRAAQRAPRKETRDVAPPSQARLSVQPRPLARRIGVARAGEPAEPKAAAAQETKCSCKACTPDACCKAPTGFQPLDEKCSSKCETKTWTVTPPAPCGPQAGCCQ